MVKIQREQADTMEKDQHDTTSNSLTLIIYNYELDDDSRVDLKKYFVQ